MKLDRQWRGWRAFERLALWTIFASCTLVGVQPLREHLSAWQSQRALEAQWRHALRYEKSQAKTISSLTATSRHKANHPVEHHRPRPVGAKKGADTKRRIADTAKAKAVGTKVDTEQDADTKAETKDADILWPLARLSCSRMKLDAVVVQGTSNSQLKRGPGHEIDTSLPGGPNCVIAAHRNAFGWWFYRLNDLQPGDFVVLQVPERKFIYRVAASRIVSVQDTSILHSRPDAAPRLTLYSCTLPKTEKRLVVIANLASSQDN